MTHRLTFRHVPAVLVALALGAVVARGARADEPAKKGPPAKDSSGVVVVSHADAEKWANFFSRLVDVMLADKDDCSKLAADINAQVDANQDLIKKAAAANDKKKVLPPDVQQRVEADGRRLGAAVQKCIADPKVGAALQRLDTHRPRN